MFGFLRIAGCRIDEDDSELYRAHFCGACHALAEFGGRLTSLLTNYDQTVLVLVVAGLEESRLEGGHRAGGPAPLARRRCTALPLRRVAVRELTERSRSLVAAFTVALVDAKFGDDVTDERRLRHRTARWLLSPRARLALRRLAADGFDATRFRDLGARQLRAEEDPGATLQTLAAPTAELLGAVFAHFAAVTGRPDLEPYLRSLGVALGRFVYVWDACEDREEDTRRGRFNALERVLAGGDDLAPGRAFLDEQLEVMSHSLSALPLGRPANILAALEETLRSRVERALPVEDPLGARPEYRSQRGDCDVCCICGEGASCCDCLCLPFDCCPGGRRRRERRRRGAPTDPR